MRLASSQAMPMGGTHVPVLTAAGRVVWNGPRDVELAGSFSEGRTTAVDTESANGLEGRSQSGYRFFERLYVDGRRTRVGGGRAVDTRALAHDRGGDARA